MNGINDINRDVIVLQDELAQHHKIGGNSPVAITLAPDEYEYPLFGKVLQLQRDLTDEAARYLSLQKELSTAQELLVIERAHRAHMADECDALRREVAIWKAAAQHSTSRTEED